MRSKVDEYEDFQPGGRGEWRAWLEANHARKQGVWLVYFKKASGKPRVSYDEAVEEALCFGWIDSLPRKLDDARSKLLFTPRKKKSVWSKPNKQRVARLLENGLMRAAGLAKIEEAKRDGSWNALDASDNLEIPPDVARAFARNKTAQANFERFSDAVKRVILSWIFSAKRPETRSARIAKTVSMAAENKRAQFDKE